MCVIDTNHIVLVNCNCNQTLNHLQNWEYHSDIIGLIFIISAAPFVVKQVWRENILNDFPCISNPTSTN